MAEVTSHCQDQPTTIFSALPLRSLAWWRHTLEERRRHVEDEGRRRLEAYATEPDARERFFLERRIEEAAVESATLGLLLDDVIKEIRRLKPQIPAAPPSRVEFVEGRR